MAKKNQNKITTAQKVTKGDANIAQYLSITIFVLLAILIFYPPFMRGLFFSKEMFVTHVITAVIFILVWINKLIKRDYKFLETPLDWAIIAYTGAYLLSLFAAVHISDAIYGLMKVLNYFMIYWMVTNTVREFGDYEKILKVLVASGFGVALIGILAALKIVNYPLAFQDQTILSTLQYPNSTAAFLSAMLLIVLTLLNLEKKLYEKVILEFIGYIMLLVILCTLSKGAWLILVAGGLLLFIGVPANTKIKTAFNLGIIILAAGISFSKFYPAIIAGRSADAYIFLVVGTAIIGLGVGLKEGLASLEPKNKKMTIFIAGAIMLLVLAVGYHKLSTSYQQYLPNNLSYELTRLENFNDVSYSVRFDMIRWGTAIVKDHPVIGTGAGGWNALYHQYQDKRYWATEVHNHYLQVWIEAGTIGLLAFLSIWVCFIWAVIRIKKILEFRAGPEASNQWMLVWGTFSGALALGLHAGMDFDLSLGAMCILLWVLFALVNSADKILLLPQDTAYLSRPKLLLNGVLAVIISLGMLINGISFATAAFSAENGDKAMVAMSKSKDANNVNQEYNLARSCYERAVAGDSRNSYYKAKLANAYSLEWKALYQNNDSSANLVYQNTVDLINQALKLRPYDTDLDNILIESASNIGSLDMMLKIARYSMKANPNDINSYNLYAQTLGKGIEYYKNNNNTNGERKLALELVNVEKMVNDQKNRIDQSDPSWATAPLVLNQDSQKYIAEAHAYLGN